RTSTTPRGRSSGSRFRFHNASRRSARANVTSAPALTQTPPAARRPAVTRRALPMREPPNTEAAAAAVAAATEDPAGFAHDGLLDDGRRDVRVETEETRR